MSSPDPIDVIYDGVIFATLIYDRPPTKQVKHTRKKQMSGGDEERGEEFDKGRKLHAHADNNEVHAAFFLGSRKAKLSVPDRGRSGNYQKFLRGMTLEDLEGIFQATGRLLDMIDEDNETLK
jgi:hypothetical protein